MSESLRVQSGSISRGSYTIPVGSDAETVNLSLYRQGKDIKTFDDLSIGNARKIRSNTDIKRTLDGRDLSDLYFDDSLSPIIFVSSSAEVSSPSIAGRLGSRIDHTIENRDLGQTSFYEDGQYFESVNPEDPIEVINLLDRGRKLPSSLVDHSSLSSTDGRIDPFDLYPKIDRSITDFPFSARGVKGAGQQHIDLFLRSGFIENVYNTPGQNFIACEHYMDAPENFGNVTVPSVVNFNHPVIKPFVEVHNDAKNYYDNAEALALDGSRDIKEVLILSSASHEDSRKGFEKITVSGFVYEEGETDSVIFGGLKR